MVSSGIEGQTLFRGISLASNEFSLNNFFKISLFHIFLKKWDKGVELIHLSENPSIPIALFTKIYLYRYYTSPKFKGGRFGKFIYCYSILF